MCLPVISDFRLNKNRVMEQTMNPAWTVQDGSLARGGAQINRKIKTILVVDDNVPLLRAMHQTLLRYGYHVLESDSPEAAIEIWQSQRQNIDLLLTDVVMPGMTGLEMVDILRKSRPELKVLVTSGFLPELLRPQLARLTATAFLEKPFTSKGLIEAVQTSLGEA
jgi:two-component system, cell cycle sensor histidine kinase and response regulator CckA